MRFVQPSGRWVGLLLPLPHLRRSAPFLLLISHGSKHLCRIVELDASSHITCPHEAMSQQPKANGEKSGRLGKFSHTSTILLLGGLELAVPVLMHLAVVH